MTKDESIVLFPKKPDQPPPMFIGPFEQNYVVIEGHVIPHLTGGQREDGSVYLTLDSRFGVDIPAECAYPIVHFIADCIGVAAGFSCFDGENKRPHAPRTFGVTSATTDEEPS